MAVANSTGTQVDYPVSVTYSEGGLERSRLTVFFRSLLAIPVGIVLFLHVIGFLFTTLIAWFAILFTGRYPAGLYSYAVNVMRLTADYYGYTCYVTDQYPPFSGNNPKAATYPVQYSSEYSGHSSRLTVFFRGLLAIPAEIFGFIVAIVVGFCVIIAFFAILIAGKYPAGLLRTVEGGVRSLMRINSYVVYLTDQYPPFSFS